jgi:ubiquinol-cytochrome c reductase iron-sulfur subunit
VPDSSRPERSGVTTEVVVGFLLLAALCSAVGLGWTYVVGGQVQVEGALLGVALGALSIAIGMWARHFMPQGPVEEDRPVLASSDEERTAVAADFARGERTVLRRRVLATLLFGSLGAIGAVALFPLRSLGHDVLPELRRTAWAKGKRLVDGDGRPIRVEDLETDGVLTVFPEGVTEPEREDSQTLLLRVGEGVLTPQPGREGWTTHGYVAFSKVCTHAGCPVGLYQAETHQLVCPCHQSVFDVTAAAKAVFGPATRPLPQLPLTVEDGYLTAADGYQDPIGPAFWSWKAD